ncbi:XylR family transcriptional regulator [Pinibacter aurantiacus]|uniref:XylR family transcriptional regulator n=1 Tax=Pinibacter aurantiacus TaxID=2851599 RepID=A0A9E2SB56_9BACT|nr:XylR family transcriptional regulator [Pinibacter aurantiacus]MBV4358228.1 XylR family transcriptional regulator [Pinibacter aurantiacus]
MNKKLKIAVLVDVSRAYDRDILLGFTNFNKIHNKFIFFAFSPNYIHRENQKTLIDRVIAWKPDGILTREIEGFERLLGLDIPLIISPHTNLYKDKINLWGRNKAIGETAAVYFISKGYKNFAFLGFKDFQWSLERQAGYIGEVNRLGFNVNSFVFDNTNVLWEYLPEKLTGWLAGIEKPCAIFSVNDELNIHLLEVIKEMGGRVPDDFSVLGVDNDTMICDMSNPTLSSIETNGEQSGFKAAAALSLWIEFEEKPAFDIVEEPGNVITRNSTNALAIDDEQLRTALYYITNTAPVKEISVDDVVNATLLSRRNLERKFQQVIKSSILDEIKKVRIQRIKFLLENSELTVQQIADEMNFNNTDNITRYFKQFAGTTPKDYRNNLSQDKYLKKRPLH